MARRNVVSPWRTGVSEMVALVRFWESTKNLPCPKAFWETFRYVMYLCALALLLVESTYGGYVYGGSYGPQEFYSGYSRYSSYPSYSGYPSDYSSFPLSNHASNPLSGYASYPTSGYSGYNSYVQQEPSNPIFTVLVEQPYTVTKSVSSVPLIVIPQDSLNMLQDGHISSISPTRPVVILPAGQEATPAVRVVLRRPMLVSSSQSTISFPSGFTVVHDGLRMPIPVGAVIAPVPTGTYLTASRPYAVRVVYAIPTGPLPMQYPFFETIPTSQPNQNFNKVTSTAVSIVNPTSPTKLPALPSRPQQQPPQFGSVFAHQIYGNDNNIGLEVNRPGAPVVTILDFPSSVATPSVVFFPQTILDEGSELGNREPPQAAAPAGIVQSTAPLPNLSVFVNSKESPVLQAIRDEANKNQDQQDEQLSAISKDKIPEILYN
uniref:Uncharacterized protein n=1 Tax=Timema shepardi TaxID=629360 RepID=A0A7R9AVQ9_TIMSH|nr:unnamed protein product [Timema shepardi]